MPIGGYGIAQIGLEFGARQVARHDLTCDEWTKLCGIADLAQCFDAGDRSLDVVGMRQRTGFDPDRVRRIGTR